MEIYYINSIGDRIDFLSDKIAIQNIETLFSSEWEYSSVTSMIFGGKVKQFLKGCQEKELTLSIVADTEDEFDDMMKRMSDIFSRDIAYMQPGKLYVNDTYLSCYIYATEYSGYEDLFYITDKVIKLVTEYPNWCLELSVSITRNIDEETSALGFAVLDTTELDTAMDPSGHDQGTTTSAMIDNPLSIPAHFRATMNGPATWPRLVVGGNIYNLDKTLLANEKIIIDSKEHTCKFVNSQGVESNAFSFRNKNYSLYEKIKPGMNRVTWNERTPVNFVLYEERGEPSWK